MREGCIREREGEEEGEGEGEGREKYLHSLYPSH